MSLTQEQLDQQLLDAKIDRYDIVKRAIEWIGLKKRDEEYKKLDEAGIIFKALEDVTEGRATTEAIAELRSAKKARDEKLEEEMAKL
jgi:hypothetical protein